MDDFTTLGVIALLGVFIIGAIYNGCRKKTSENKNKKKAGLRYNTGPYKASVDDQLRSRFVKEGAAERIRRRMNN